MYRILNRYHSRRGFVLWASEAAIIFATAYAAALAFGVASARGVDVAVMLRVSALTAIFILSFYFFDLFGHDGYDPKKSVFLRIAKAVALSTAAIACVYFFYEPLALPHGMVLANAAALVVVITAWRYAASRLLKLKLAAKNVLIIGTGDLAKQIGREIYGKAVHGMNLVGFIDDDPARIGLSIVNPGIVGSYSDIPSVAESRKIDMIIVALPDRRAKLPMQSLLDCKLKGILVEEGETFNERLKGQVPLNHLKPSWMVFSDGFKTFRSRMAIKRAADFAAAVVCFVIALPVMVLTAIVIKLESRGPVIFSQRRVGENGREFDIYKFRSMRTDAESSTGPIWAGKEDDRVTRVGRFIRKVRIDELPQLVNVIRGDMSFVGPRPERPFFVEKLRKAIPYYDVRTVVKPGITGWAQVKYPYGATVEDAYEKLQYDIYYIKNMSLFLDLLICFLTVKTVFTGKGAR